ncbi:MAG: hypothetical protein ACHQ9S_19235 [Candidatus Binatia bacterium]
MLPLQVELLRLAQPGVNGHGDHRPLRFADRPAQLGLFFLAEKPHSLIVLSAEHLGPYGIPVSVAVLNRHVEQMPQKRQLAIDRCRRQELLGIASLVRTVRAALRDVPLHIAG